MCKDNYISSFITIAIIMVASYFLLPLNADVINHIDQAKSKQSDETLASHLVRLDKINYLPNLLPMIINNADVIELQQDQLDKLIAWRSENREAVISDMNEIVSMRVAIKQAAVHPETNSEQLVAFQDEIFKLQRSVLDYKLSCRELVIDTFNENNWEGLYMVMAAEGIDVVMPDTNMTADVTQLN